MLNLFYIIYSAENAHAQPTRYTHTRVYYRAKPGSSRWMEDDEAGICGLQPRITRPCNSGCDVLTTASTPLPRVLTKLEVGISRMIRSGRCHGNRNRGLHRYRSKSSQNESWRNSVGNRLERSRLASIAMVMFKAIHNVNNSHPAIHRKLKWRTRSLMDMTSPERDDQDQIGWRRSVCGQYLHGMTLVSYISHTISTDMS